MSFSLKVAEKYHATKFEMDFTVVNMMTLGLCMYCICRFGRLMLV